MTTMRDIMHEYPEGVNVMLPCPKCQENTCSTVWQGPLILWNCKRASCGHKGFMSAVWGGSVPSHAPPAFVPMSVPHNLVLAADVSKQTLYSFDGERLGTQTRDAAKSIRNWMIMDRCPYHYSPPADGLEFGFPLWLVEDIRSAETLADNGQPAVALLGTTIKDRFISEELIPWIVRNHTPKILVALDPDATITAMKQGAMLARTMCHVALAGNSFSVPFVQWVPLALDIKDMPKTRIQDLILAYAEVTE